MARAMARPAGVEGRDVAVIDAALGFRGDTICLHYSKQDRCGVARRGNSRDMDY